MKCSLCGYQFTENEHPGSCSNCPMHKDCHLIRCPNCGFEIPKEPDWAKNFHKEAKDESFLLKDMSNGQTCKVARIKTDNKDKLKKLMSLGIFPGLKITMIQKKPGVVFEIGYSQFAVDSELAECIFVQKI